MTNYTEQLTSALEATGVTGASFAYWDGKTLHTAVAGLRNSATGDPVTADTVMHIGSITKILNTVLVMQLVDDGLISLEDPVVKHLPELRLRDTDALQKITCKMLLNHTGGIDCEGLEDLGPDRERIEDAIIRCADLAQLHPPGGGPSYSNLGMVIAGYLAERLRGVSWYTLIKKRIYEPLEMRHAIADFAELPLFRQSVGDLTDLTTGKFVQTTRPFLAPSMAPCGTTLMMSASDLVTFARAMLGGGVGPNGTRILSSASAAGMAEPTVVMLYPDDMYWGLGWMISPGRVLNHGGGGPGVNSILYAHPESGQAVALLTNCDRGLVLKSAVLDPILTSWTGIVNGAPERQHVSVDPHPYEGAFGNKIGRAEVYTRDGGLFMRESAPTVHFYDTMLEDGYYPETALRPLGDHVFETASADSDAPGTQFKFVYPDSDGRMHGVVSGPRLRMRIE